jgi:hypothetical protein
VFAAMNNVAGQSPQPEGQPRSKIKQCSDDSANRADDQKGPSEFAEWVHEPSLKLPGFEVKAERITAARKCPAPTV